MTDEHLSQLRFTCTECGDCCRRAGEVRFDDDTFLSMAAHLDVDVATFRSATDVRYDEGAFEPWYFEVESGETCPLLVDGLCTVHPARPRQCRTYPFWPDNTRTPSAWDRESKQCPGIGLGEPWPRSEVTRRVALEASAEAAAGKADAAAYDEDRHGAE